MIEKKYHYVYEITYSTGMKYIGVRSCNCEIEDDSYMGSAFHIPDDIKSTGVKKVLSTHKTRYEAVNEEIRIHAELNVKDNPLYYNQCNSCSTKFYPSKEAHERGAKKRTGRSKESHDYIRKQVQVRKKYKGKGLTEAQKAQWNPDRMPDRIRKYKETLAATMEDPIKAARITEARIQGGKSCTGIKNPKKGHKGLDHPRVESWGYLNPDGVKTIVNDSIRNYCQLNPSVFPFSSASVMRYIREKVPNKIKKLGWDFGKTTGEE